MEKRLITVINSISLEKSEFMSDATTLAELKKDMVDHGVSFHDNDNHEMVFNEGFTKTIINDNDSQLPTEVLKPRTNERTNSLLFRLTKRNKSISSGAYTRKELLEKAKEIIAKYPNAFKDAGISNITQTKSDVLEVVIAKYSKATKATKVTKAPKETKVTKEVSKPKSTSKKVVEETKVKETKVKSKTKVDKVDKVVSTSKIAPSKFEDSLDDDYIREVLGM